MTGGTVGKSYFVQDLNQKMYVNQRVADIKISNIINSKYVNYLILSPLTQDKITSCKNSTNDNISIQDIKEFYVPLPPLAEQHRIVEKLEEILPLVDEYGKNEEKLSNISFYQSTFIREENNNCYKFIKGKVIYKLGEQQKLIEIHFTQL